MFKFSASKNKKRQPQDSNQASSTHTDAKTENNSLAKGLARTRHKWIKGLTSIILGKKTIAPDLIKEIETYLLTADVGVATTQRIIQHLTDELARGQLNDSKKVFDTLCDYLEQALLPLEQTLTLPESNQPPEPNQPPKPNQPYVILCVGINGGGKTTTIGKLAVHCQAQGKTVLLAAGDTFRAAAVEQLKIWGSTHNVPVVAQGTGADSASVCFDALQSAQSRGIDVVIIDTAGRLHTKENLMQELSKIKRVLTKLDSSAPHEVLLVLDATTGQNGLRQAQAFQKAVGVTGLVLTKLDGTAKGGILFSIAETLGLPVRFVGVGEGAKDLKPFNARTFVEALLHDNT